MYNFSLLHPCICISLTVVHSSFIKAIIAKKKKKKKRSKYSLFNDLKRMKYAKIIKWISKFVRNKLTVCNFIFAQRRNIKYEMKYIGYTDIPSDDDYNDCWLYICVCLRKITEAVLILHHQWEKSESWNRWQIIIIAIIFVFFSFHHVCTDIY